MVCSLLCAPASSQTVLEPRAQHLQSRVLGWVYFSKELGMRPKAQPWEECFVGRMLLQTH